MPITAKDLDVRFASSGAERVKGELRALHEAVTTACDERQPDDMDARVRERFTEAISRAIVDRQCKAVADSLAGLPDAEYIEAVNDVEGVPDETL